MSLIQVHAHCLDGAAVIGKVTVKCGDYEQPAAAQIADWVESGKPLTLWNGDEFVVIPVSSIARLVVPARARCAPIQAG